MLIASKTFNVSMCSDISQLISFKQVIYNCACSVVDSCLFETWNFTLPVVLLPGAVWEAEAYNYQYSWSDVACHGKQDSYNYASCVVVRWEIDGL